MGTDPKEDECKNEIKPHKKAVGRPKKGEKQNLDTNGDINSELNVDETCRVSSRLRKIQSKTEITGKYIFILLYENLLPL